MKINRSLDKWIYGFLILLWPMVMACSVESLLSNPAARVRFPRGSGIIISILELAMSFVCALPYIVSGGGLNILLTTVSGKPALVFWFIVWLLLQASNPRAYGL